jgi:hypothetical protein
MDGFHRSAFHCWVLRTADPGHLASAFVFPRFCRLTGLSKLEELQLTTIKAGSPNSKLDDVAFLLSFLNIGWKTTIRITRFRNALLLYGAYLEHWRAAVKCFFFLVP